MGYRKAPTWLFNIDGETAFFKTQEGVDQAWEDGWFGPKSLAQKTPLMSDMEFTSKAHRKEIVESDPRYIGLRLNNKKTVEELEADILEFEKENGLTDTIMTTTQ